MTGVTHVPGSGRMLAAAQILVIWERGSFLAPLKKMVDPKDATAI